MLLLISSTDDDYFVVISAIVAKLNRLLDQLNVNSRLKTVADIGVGVFVTA